MSKNTAEVDAMPQNTMVKTLGLVFLPALIMLVSPYLLTHMADAGRTLVLSSYYLVEVIVLAGIMMWVVKKERSSFKNIIGYTKRVSFWVFIGFAAFGAAYAIYMRDFLPLPGLRSVSFDIMSKMQGWPSIYAMLPAHDGVFEDAGKGLGIAGLLISTLAVSLASMMQTLYFRGFLLSRLERFGWLAPVIITFLFVVFHLGSPWFWPQFLLLTLSWAFIAYFTKNVWIIVVSHVAMNSYSGLFLIVSVLLG